MQPTAFESNFSEIRDIRPCSRRFLRNRAVHYILLKSNNPGSQRLSRASSICESINQLVVKWLAKGLEIKNPIGRLEEDEMILSGRERREFL
jgi:hypothetical protein